MIFVSKGPDHDILTLMKKKILIMWEKGSKAVDYSLLFRNNASAVWWLKNRAVPRAAAKLTAATEAPPKILLPTEDQSFRLSVEVIVDHQMTQPKY